MKPIKEVLKDTIKGKNYENIVREAAIKGAEKQNSQKESWEQRLDNGFRDGSLKWNGNKKNQVSFERIKTFFAKERLLAITQYQALLLEKQSTPGRNFSTVKVEDIIEIGKEFGV